MRDVDVLADNVGAHPDTLRRLMRALATVGVYDETPDGRYVNSDIGDMLRADEGSLYPALHRMEENRWIHAEWIRKTRVAGRVSMN